MSATVTVKVVWDATPTTRKINVVLKAPAPRS
jgi:hypothetical protein